MNQVIAFYDDSGVFNPDNGKFVCFGMCVVPALYIRECSDAWWEMLGGHFPFIGSLQTSGIEAKSSELNNMVRSLENNSKLNEGQQRMYDNGLNTVRKVTNLREAIFNFLAKPPVTVKYLAVAVNKREDWLKFRPDQLNQFEVLKNSKYKKQALRNLREELASSLVKNAYGFLLQRLEYLSKDSEDPDFNFTDAFVVGDQSSHTKVILEAQTGIQAGLGKSFSTLPTLVNRSWWGSSLHDPCLQIADWVAFTVRAWAEAKEHSSRIEQLLPYFRGYPIQDKLIGRGIVLCPSKECFPSMPLKDEIL